MILLAPFTLFHQRRCPLCFVPIGTRDTTSHSAFVSFKMPQSTYSGPKVHAFACVCTAYSRGFRWKLMKHSGKQWTSWKDMGNFTCVGGRKESKREEKRWKRTTRGKHSQLIALLELGNFRKKPQFNTSDSTFCFAIVVFGRLRVRQMYPLFLCCTGSTRKKTGDFKLSIMDEK